MRLALPFALVLAACQPGALTTPAVAAIPPAAKGAPVFLPEEPTIERLDDPDARPLAMTLEHAVRDALQEAGWKVIGDQDASGLSLEVRIARASRIQADLFIKGAEVCGVNIVLRKGETEVAIARPESTCLSTSAYYGMVPKDAAVAMVNDLTRQASVIAAASAAASRKPPWASAP
jgi:hypothetical protein